MNATDRAADLYSQKLADKRADEKRRLIPLIKRTVAHSGISLSPEVLQADPCVDCWNDTETGAAYGCPTCKRQLELDQAFRDRKPIVITAADRALFARASYEETTS